MSNISDDAHMGNDFEALSVAEDAAQVPQSATPIDYEEYRLDGSPVLATTLVTLAMLICKPRPDWLVRCHPNRLFRFIALVLRDVSEYYIIHPSLSAAVVGLAHKHILIPSITSRGKLFFWPIRLANDKGRLDPCNTTASGASEKAINTWLRIAYSDQLGDYVVNCVADKVDEPKWPNLTFREMMDLAFPGRIITSLDDPVLRELFNDEDKKQR